MTALHQLILQHTTHAYAFHRVITDHSGKAIDYEYLEVNHSFLKMLGLTKSQVIGKRVTEILPGIEKDDFNWIRFYGEVAITKKPQRINQYSEKLKKWYKVSAFCPEIGYFVALFDDITEEHELAQKQELLVKAHKIQENKFRTLFEHNPDALFLLSRECFIDCNESAVKLLGARSRAEIIGKSPIDLSPESQPDGSYSKARAGKIIRDVFNGIDQRFEWQHIRIDGTPFNAEVILTLLPYGDQPVIYTVVRDITDRYRAEAQLRKVNENFRLVMANSPDMIWIRDLNFRLIYINPAVERMKGFTPEEAMTRNLRENVTPETYGKFLRLLQEEFDLEQDPLADKTRTKRFESDEVCKDGSIIHTETIASFIRDEGGNATGILGITRDITEQQNTYKELRAAKIKAEESERLKTAFLANMSHEIRTPMNSIVGFAELLGEEDTDPAMRKKHIEIIQKSSDHLLTLISDIIDFSKIESEQLDLRYQTLNLDDFMHDLGLQFQLIRDQLGKKDINVEIIPCDCNFCSMVRIDPVRVKQVLINLFQNALKFTAAGTITIGYHNQKEGLFHFLVRDSGPGISKEYQGIIFQRFRQGDENLTRKYGGTGLGLAICKGLVDLMGGEIGVISEEGRGSEFWFTIPNTAVNTATLPSGNPSPNRKSSIVNRKS